jgi:GH35 family endo-1,4-beta-xylanase
MLKKLWLLVSLFPVVSGNAMPLKDAYEGDFLIGCAMGSVEVDGAPSHVFPMRKDQRELEIVKREFNSVTAENLMKWQYLNPAPGKFNFTEADEFVDFAEKNGQVVVGHAPVWHAMLPGWVFVDENGGAVSREELIERMREYIHTVVGRYKGRVKYWDVVNEAVETKEYTDENGKLVQREAFLRDSLWRKIIGDDYIELAFRFAHEADPEALLLYNDYGMTHPEKAAFVADMVRGLKARGVPIHGVGIQAHWHLEYPSTEELQAAIDMYASAGVKVSLTELDIGVLPLATDYRGADISKQVELQEELNPYTNGVPVEVLRQQAEKYRAMFDVLLKNREDVERVTFWGVSDAYSWRNNWPVQGRTGHPLLFDRNYESKSAYHALQQAAVAGRPNLIVIVCDDLNDAVGGFGGHPQARTPNIDRFAKRGVRFTNAASNCPLCGPSRASLWSGLHPNTTGYYGYKQQLNHWRRNPVLKDTKTVFEHFTQNGYRNFSTGKIHHNGHEELSIFENPDGFPGFGSQGNFGPIPNDGKPENLRHGVLPPWMPEKLRKEGGWGDGFGPVQDLKRYGDEYGWTMFHSGETWEIRNGYDRDPMPDEICASEAVEFLGKEHEAPFLLTVGFTRPHSPWYAPQEYFDLFPLDSIKLTPLMKNDIDDCSKILTEQHDIAQPWGWQKYRKIMENGGGTQLRKWTQAYLACVAFVDDQTGRILDALEKSPYAENTLVIFTSDHGYHMGEKEYLFKYSPWEESVRIPLVVAGPGVAENRECATPVSLIDLYPTLVDYADLSVPHLLDGFSMRPLLENPASGTWAGPPFTLAASASTVPVEQDVPASADDQHFSLRTERYRYIRCRNGEEELYDHQSDPHEWTNLAGRKEYQSALEALRSRLDDAVNKRQAL